MTTAVRQPEVIVALTTPFTRRGRVDGGALAAHTDWCLSSGVSGIMPCGTTGEGPLLEDREVAKAVATVAAVANGRAVVFAHVGRIGTAATIRLAQEAMALGVSKIAAVVPYYFRFTQAQLLRHFEAIMRAVPDAGLYAYCIPANTGTDISDETLRSMLQGGLAGVKDSTKSLERHRTFLTLTRSVYMGTDELVAQAFDLGSAGCISAIANIRPDLLLNLQSAPRSGQDHELLSLRGELYNAADKLVELKRRIASIISGYPTTVRAPLGV